MLCCGENLCSLCPRAAPEPPGVSPLSAVYGHQQAQTSIGRLCKNQGWRLLSDYSHQSDFAWLLAEEDMFTFIKQNNDYNRKLTAIWFLKSSKLLSTASVYKTKQLKYSEFPLHPCGIHGCFGKGKEANFLHELLRYVSL